MDIFLNKLLMNILTVNNKYDWSKKIQCFLYYVGRYSNKDIVEPHDLVTNKYFDFIQISLSSLVHLFLGKTLVRPCNL